MQNKTTKTNIFLKKKQQQSQTKNNPENHFDRNYQNVCMCFLKIT